MKKLVALLLAAVMLLALTACGEKTETAAPADTSSTSSSASSSGAKLRFVTGGESGTYYAFGSVIAQHATNNAGVNVVGLVGNGSQANVMNFRTVTPSSHSASPTLWPTPTQERTSLR